MNISELENVIRDFVNSPRRLSVLLKNKEGWNTLCSAMDLLGDTNLAIKAYPKMCDNTDDGSSYLIIYGILQTMLLQQDAAKEIAKVLDIKIRLPKELANIRIIRNSAAGHPTNQAENKVKKSCFISRYSISPVGFELMTTYSEGKDYEMSHINIPKLICTQEEYLKQLLKTVISELEAREMAHRNQFKDTKLVDIFPSSLRYSISKVFEATYDSRNYSIGKINFAYVEKVLDDLKIELERRSEWGAYDSIDHYYGLLEYPISKLNEYFSLEACGEINSQDAYIYMHFISNQLDSLKEICKELDATYSNSSTC